MQVLARHSNSVKIVSLYVKFLQGVRNNPWSAARWGAELEKMQRMEEEANESYVQMIFHVPSAMRIVRDCCRWCCLLWHR
jgi:hypothetical protein